MQRPLEWELPAGKLTFEVSLRQARGPPPRSFSRLLNRLDQAVGDASKHRPIGKVTRREVLAVKVDVSPADMNAFKKLRRAALGRCLRRWAR